jgi:exonuclease III
MRVVTWNMSHWEQRGKVSAQWDHLASLEPDVALLQEAAHPTGVATSWKFVPGAPWTIDEDRPWGSGVASPEWLIKPITNAKTVHGAHEFQLIADDYYRGALAVAELEVPELGRVAVASVYALMKPYYAQTTLLRMVADLIPLFDARGYDHYVLGGDLNVHTQVKDVDDLRRYQAILAAIESLGLVNCFKQVTGHRPPLAGCPCHEEVCYHARTHLHGTHVGTPKEAVGGHNDYVFASPRLAECVTAIQVEGDYNADIWKLSNHCPVIVDFDAG